MTSTWPDTPRRRFLDAHHAPFDQSEGYGSNRSKPKWKSRFQDGYPLPKHGLGCRNLVGEDPVGIIVVDQASKPSAVQLADRLRNLAHLELGGSAEPFQPGLGEVAVLAVLDGHAIGLALLTRGARTELMDWPTLGQLEDLGGRRGRYEADRYVLSVAWLARAHRGKGHGRAMLEACGPAVGVPIEQVAFSDPMTLAGEAAVRSILSEGIIIGQPVGPM